MRARRPGQPQPDDTPNGRVSNSPDLSNCDPLPFGRPYLLLIGFGRGVPGLFDASTSMGRRHYLALEDLDPTQGSRGPKTRTPSLLHALPKNPGNYGNIIVIIRIIMIIIMLLRTIPIDFPTRLSTDRSATQEWEWEVKRPATWLLPFVRK